MEPRFISHSPLQTLLASAIQRYQRFKEWHQMLHSALSKLLSHLGSKKKKIRIASPANSFSVRLTCTEDCCFVLVTKKFGEFQTEGGSQRPGWGGPVGGCWASSFLSSTARDLQLLPLYVRPWEGWSIFWFCIYLEPHFWLSLCPCATVSASHCLALSTPASHSLCLPEVRICLEVQLADECKVWSWTF